MKKGKEKMPLAWKFRAQNLKNLGKAFSSKEPGFLKQFQNELKSESSALRLEIKVRWTYQLEKF